jgi:hypothetical protein
VKLLNNENVEFPNGLNEVEFIDGLIQAIVNKRALLHDSRVSSYSGLDLVKLLISIETAKLRFAYGQISAQQLYRDMIVEIGRFKIRHLDFDFLNETFLDAYFS